MAVTTVAIIPKLVEVTRMAAVAAPIFALAELLTETACWLPAAAAAAVGIAEPTVLAGEQVAVLRLKHDTISAAIPIPATPVVVVLKTQAEQQAAAGAALLRVHWAMEVMEATAVAVAVAATTAAAALATAAAAAVQALLMPTCVQILRIPKVLAKGTAG
jgi:hypothetical protein